MGKFWRKNYRAHSLLARVCLHLSKQFCELPLMPFPEKFPTYPSKQQFIEYLEAYAERFDRRPRFNETVARAEYDHMLGFWPVKTETKEYVCRWLIVASGENVKAMVPKISIGLFMGLQNYLNLFKW